MANRNYREPITIQYYSTTSDGQGGIVEGSINLTHTCNAWISEKQETLITDGLKKFQFSQTIRIWNDPQYTITEKSFVLWRGKRLTIEGFELSGDQRTITLKTISE